MILGFPEIAILVTNVAFQEKDVAFGIILAESGGNTKARNIVQAPGKPWHLSVDRGIFQFNSYWHPEVTDEMADDPLIAAMCAAWISKGGTSWSAWSTYNHGSHEKYLPTARTYLSQVME